MTAVAWTWEWRSLGCRLSVTQAVADVLGQYRQRSSRSERGGQLFLDLDHPAGLMISLATPPHSRDRAGWTWLELNAERCRREIEIANAQGLRLVGYWHTHPQAIPMISSTDVKSFKRFAARYASELPHPIAVIVGLSPERNGIKAWLFHGESCIEATLAD